MPAPSLLGPFASPHRTKQFWLFVGVLILVALTAPFLQALLGLPPFPRPIQITSGLAALMAMMPAVWIAFRLGPLGWLLFAIIMLVFGLSVRYDA